MIAPAQQRLDDAYQVLKDMLVCQGLAFSWSHPSTVSLTESVIYRHLKQEATQSDDEINSTDEFSSAKKVYDEVTAELTTQ